MSSSVFDWYQCSIFDDDGQNLHSRVVLCLLNNLDLVTTQPIKALHGYQEALAICRGTHTVCRLMWGGNPGVNVWATGENARLVAPLIRQFFPNHKVTRCDAAHDWSSPGLSGVVEGGDYMRVMLVNRDGATRVVSAANCDRYADTGELYCHLNGERITQWTAPTAGISRETKTLLPVEQAAS